jgi:hypothetical protein
MLIGYRAVMATHGSLGAYNKILIPTLYGKCRSEQTSSGKGETIDNVNCSEHSVAMLK